MAINSNEYLYYSFTELIIT